ncbi:MAG TPA: hypothetical protein DCP36_06790 [Sporomusaceae bacterium]|nr:hypothetical protein [Sporomusaceae bacterium]
MKRTLIAALAATFVLTAACTTFARPLQFDGKVQYQHRINTKEGTADAIENRWKFVLNGKAENFAKNMKLYFRMSAETLNGDTQSSRDFNSFPGQDDNDRSVISFLDQFGIEIQNAGWNYKIGRQDAFIGANGLIYDSAYGIGKHIFADGITITGKSGVTNISATALQLDQYGHNDPKIYAFAASYNPSKDLAVGTTLVKLNGDKLTTDKKFWDVNSSYNITNKLNVYGEYAKSDAATYNKSYVYGINYDVDKKNSLWTCYTNVERSGNIVDNWSTTTYDNNAKGMYYGFGHKFDKTTTLNLFYSRMEKIETVGSVPAGTKFTSFRSTLTYKF